MKRIIPYISFISCWLIFLTIAASLVPSPLITDSGYGFLAMCNFQHGGSFNTIITPAINDISKSCVPSFLSMWSPGQWVAPWLFLFFPIKLNTALALTVGLFSALGVIGYYRLFRLLGFTDLVSILSVTLLCAARYFVLNFQIYHGGEVLQFGGLPWLLMICYKERKSYLDFLLIILSMVVAYFLKSSAILMVILFTLAYRYYADDKSSAGKRFEVKKLSRLIMPFAALLLGWLLCSSLFIRHGLTPLTMHAKSVTPLSSIKSFFFIVAGPLSATIGMDTYFGHFVQNPLWALIFYMLLAVVFVLFCVYYIKSKGPHYSRQPILIICLGYIVFFLLNYFPLRHNISANTDARHFRPAAILLVPLIIEFLFEKFNKRSVQVALVALIIILSGYDALSYAKKLNEKPLAVSKTWGFGHVNINDAVLSFIEAHRDSGITWYFISPEIALEAPNGSAMVFHDNGNDIPAIRKRSIRGRANKLCIILPDNYRINGAMEAIIHSFKDYRPDEFQYHELSGFTIISNNVVVN